jgi:hypothetical protein
MAFGNSILGGNPQGSILGGQPMAPRIPWAQNPLVTTVGLSLLGAPTLQAGFQNVSRNAPVGMAAKTSLQDKIMARQEEEAERAKRTAAWNAGLIWKSKGDAGLTEQQRADLAAVPEIAAKFMPEQPSPTDDMREYEFARSQGFGGSFQDYMTGQKRAGATQVTVGGTNKYAEEVDKGIATDFLDMQKAGRAASETKTSLSAMRSLMDDPNFYSGAGAEGVLGLKRAWVALGGDPNATASTEAFNALAKKSALDSMGGSLGTGFSNADRDFVIQQTANLGNTPEGNRALIETNIKIAERKEQTAKMARDYASQNDGRIDYAFYDQLAQWAEANPLFPQQPQATPSSDTGPAPAGVSPEEWNVMTPEERALFQ